jgi:hypothetical protein
MAMPQVALAAKSRNKNDAAKKVQKRSFRRDPMRLLKG